MTNDQSIMLYGMILQGLYSAPGVMQVYSQEKIAEIAATALLTAQDQWRGMPETAKAYQEEKLRASIEKEEKDQKN